MRRNEFDENGQPQRNLVTNPGFQVANGNGAVQTNYVTAPNMELTGANTVIVRTNLCTDPRGIFNTSAYGTGATITPNVAIAGHPAGITTAIRVAYDAASSNPGINILNPLTAGTTYTASAWVYHETTGGGSQGLAQAGVASMPSPPAITAGVWTRISWTFTASGTSQLGYRVSAPTGAASYLITGMLVEVGSVLKPFFDGATVDSNLALSAASAQSLITFTSGVSYQGLTWQRAATPAGTGGAIVRQMVNNASLVNGEAYTASVLVANDQAYTQQVSIDWCDLNYVTVTLQPGEVRRLVTTAAKATYDSVYRFSDLQVTQSSTEGRSVLFREFLVERGTTAGDYYQGAGDFNYVWSGTANASTSYQRGTAVNTWSSTSGGSNRFADISSTAWTNSGVGKSIRIIPLQSNDGTINASYAEINVAGLTVGNTYYVRGINRTTQALAAGYDSASYRKVVYPGTAPSSITHLTTPTNGAGVFEYRGSFVATNTFHGIRFYNGAGDGGGDVWWDEVSVTDTPVTYYFDGSTPAAGDFTYLWTGTANASTSQQRSTGIVNVSAGNAQIAQSSEWSLAGGKSLRIIPNNQFSTTSAIISGIPLEYGKTYTAIATRRLNAPLTGTLSAYAGTISSVQIGVGTFYSNVLPNVAGAGVARLVFKHLAQGAWTVRLGHGGAAGSGDVWWDHFAVYEGDYQGDYINPDQNPLARWDGTVNASTSIGYPPQVNDVAGVPAAQLTGTSGDTGNILAPDPFAARTLYFVYEHSDINIAWQAPLYYARPAGGGAEGMVMQTSDIGAQYMYPRADFINGTQNATTILANGRGNGRHVISMSFPQGLASSLASIDGAADVSRLYPDPAAGWASGRLYAVTRTGIAHVHSRVYYAEHSTATRLAISRALAARYGATCA